jgi:hypothetical protein
MLLSNIRLKQMQTKETTTVLLLFVFQFVLGLSPPDLPGNLVSGGKILDRPISTGKQDFETNKSVWPLNKPVPKLEAVTQCSGKSASMHIGVGTLQSSVEFNL